MPVGATEQHGYHMTLGVDTMLPVAISKMIAQNVNGLVAPALAYGYKSQPRSGGGNHYIGTTSLSAASLIGSLKDILLELARHGCRKVVKIDYYEFITEATLQLLFPNGFPGWALEHAAVFETSLMLHLHPELVHMNELADEQPASFPSYDVYPTNLDAIPPSGVLSPAGSATAAKGKRIADEYDVLITACVKKEFELS